MLENKTVHNLRVNHSRMVDGTSSATSSQFARDFSDLGSIPAPYDISSKQSQTSGASKTRNINLLELKMMAANRALKSSNDLLRIDEPKDDLKISPIYETRSEENRDDYDQEDYAHDSFSIENEQISKSKLPEKYEEDIAFNKGNLNLIAKPTSISVPRNIEDYDDSNYVSIHQNQNIPGAHRIHNFTNDNSSQQKFQPKQKNIDFFKLKVQEQIAKNMLSDDRQTITKVSEFRRPFKKEEVKSSSIQSKARQTPAFLSRSVDKQRRTESESSSKQSEVVSDDSSLQEFVLATDHKINQIEINNFKLPGNKANSLKFHEVYDSSSRKEITEFEVGTPEISEHRFTQIGRESNIADGLKPSIDEEEEDMQSTLRFNLKNNESIDKNYLKPKKLEETQALK